MQHSVVSREEWLAARRALLAEEKAHTKAYDRLMAARRALPWVRLDKPYAFQGPGGRLGLGDLFRGRSQLVLQHFMLGPEDRDPCPGCSFQADHVDSARLHFEQHDLAFAAVSRAPLARIEAVKRRMGWSFPWVSSSGSDFNHDFGVSFTPAELAEGRVVYNYAPLPEPWGEEMSGVSVFYRDADGGLFHTYSTYGRGTDLLVGAYNYLDLTPKGRDETGPHFNLMDWVKLHDQYREPALPPASCCG